MDPGLINPYIPRLGAGRDGPASFSRSPRVAQLPAAPGATDLAELRLPRMAESPRSGKWGDSPRSRYSANSTAAGTTPRAAEALKTGERKRLERLQDSYQTAVSKETLLSEQYDKELAVLHEQILGIELSGVASKDRISRQEQGFQRERSKLGRAVPTAHRV